MIPTVSVIIPTYNVENYIDECIQSILNQTFKDFEIIICDDCSTDGTLTRIEKYCDYSNIRVFKNEKNLGQALTRNKCIENSKGNFILIQDADDISVPNRIEILLNEFEPNIDFVGSACFCFNENDGIFENLVNKHIYPKPKNLLYGISFVHASIIFRRNCIESVGGYRSTKHTMRGEDYDLIMRLYADGFQGKNIPNLLYGYRVGIETIGRRTLKARVDECFVRFHGFKSNRILFPLGIFFVFKPIAAHFYQLIKYGKHFKKRKQNKSSIIV